MYVRSLKVKTNSIRRINISDKKLVKFQFFNHFVDENICKGCIKGLSFNLIAKITPQKFWLTRDHFLSNRALTISLNLYLLQTIQFSTDASLSLTKISVLFELTKYLKFLNLEFRPMMRKQLSPCVEHS